MFDQNLDDTAYSAKSSTYDFVLKQNIRIKTLRADSASKSNFKRVDKIHDNVLKELKQINK